MMVRSWTWYVDQALLQTTLPILYGVYPQDIIRRCRIVQTIYGERLQLHIDMLDTALHGDYDPYVSKV